MGTGTQKYGNFTEVRYTHVSKKLQTEVLPINFTEETTLRMNGCFRTVSFSPHRQARHHLVLTASYHSGKGIWRDQKMMTDTEHGNLVYYETLSKYKIQDDRRMTAGLEYRFERLKDDKQDFFVDALAAFTSSAYNHQLSTGKAKQTSTLLTTQQLSAGKFLNIKSAGLDLSVHGGYRIPLSRTYGNGNTRTADEDISAVYTRPQFEYSASGHALIGALAQVAIPLPKKITLGIYISTDFKFYTDKNEYDDTFDGTNRSLFYRRSIFAILRISFMRKRNIYSIISLWCVLFFCPTLHAERKGFAVVIDSISYQQAQHELAEYIRALESKQHFKVYTVVDRWGYRILSVLPSKVCTPGLTKPS